MKETSHNRGNKHTGGKCNNVTPAEPVTGNSRSYTLSRLSKARPDLFAKVKAGELSANAAAIEAGWRKQPSELALLRAAWGGTGAIE